MGHLKKYYKSNPETVSLKGFQVYWYIICDECKREKSEPYFTQAQSHQHSKYSDHSFTVVADCQGSPRWGIVSYERALLMRANQDLSWLEAKVAHEFSKEEKLWMLERLRRWIHDMRKQVSVSNNVARSA